MILITNDTRGVPAALARRHSIAVSIEKSVERDPITGKRACSYVVLFGRYGKETVIREPNLRSAKNTVRLLWQLTGYCNQYNWLRSNVARKEYARVWRGFSWAPPSKTPNL